MWSDLENLKWYGSLRVYKEQNSSVNLNVLPCIMHTNVLKYSEKRKLFSVGEYSLDNESQNTRFTAEENRII